MHELALCQGLMRHVIRVAAEHGATVVERVVVSAGPLSGVEPALLVQAFSVARAGTVASDAELDIEVPPVTVLCRLCGAAGEARSNRLVCPGCGDWRVQVTQGEDLVLMRLEMSLPESPAGMAARETMNGVNHHV